MSEKFVPAWRHDVKYDKNSTPQHHGIGVVLFCTISLHWKHSAYLAPPKKTRKYRTFDKVCLIQGCSGAEYVDLVTKIRGHAYQMHVIVYLIQGYSRLGHVFWRILPDFGKYFAPLMRGTALVWVWIQSSESWVWVRVRVWVWARRYESYQDIFTH